MNTEFNDLVSIIHNKEWRFKQHIDERITVGSQFVVTALLEENPSEYVVGLYGKTYPDSNSRVDWYTYRFNNLDDVFKFFEHVDFVADHTMIFANLYSKLPLNDPSN